VTSVILDPTDPTTAFIADATDNIWGAHIGDAVLVNVHNARVCLNQDRPCIIHNPSEHHMREWPLTWRGDKGVFERRCPHGPGHPDPDDAAYQVSIGNGAINIHGCDGCCRPE
jgi:hypothetical protein